MDGDWTPVGNTQAVDARDADELQVGSNQRLESNLWSAR